MFNVICVLKSGGIYDATWVEKLKNGCERNLPKHVFNCLSDVPVPCNRIPLIEDWPAWWGKIALFKKGVIDGPHLYLDLDTVLVGKVDVSKLTMDFGMLRNFWQDDMVGSGVMWFSGENVPHKVYEKFARQPKAYIEHHQRNADGPYVGDQAFIFDVLDRKVDQVNDCLAGIKSYKMHCQRRLPSDAAIVCFHGRPRPNEIDAEWMKEHWR